MGLTDLVCKQFILNRLHTIWLILTKFNILLIGLIDFTFVPRWLTQFDRLSRFDHNAKFGPAPGDFFITSVSSAMAASAAAETFPVT